MGKPRFGLENHQTEGLRFGDFLNCHQTAYHRGLVGLVSRFSCTLFKKKKNSNKKKNSKPKKEQQAKKKTASQKQKQQAKKKKTASK
ncbi:hypothetical protein Syun_017626 [Stephania yunnanensis]|uniref:Uncharacterized protein n=1 Tax=Stephania yunnanensis TaxID=152371 RepID=A0AAP0P3J4_9MAGN